MIVDFNKYKEIEIVKNFNRDISERAYIDTDGNYITLENGDNDPKAHDKILALFHSGKEFDFLQDNNWIKISMKKIMYFLVMEI